MKKFVKLLLIGIILLLLFSSYSSSAVRFDNLPIFQKDPEEPDENLDIPINRNYLIAQVSGEIIITDQCNYTKSLIPDIYRNIELNGTVTNSTLLDPFTIWPPISWIPFLRTIFLPDDAPVYLNIRWFKGKFVPKDGDTKVRFYGEALIINIRTTLKLNGNFYSNQR